MGSRLVQGLVAIAVSIAFLWFAFRGLDAAALWQNLSSLSGGAIGLYLLSIFTIHLLRFYRWHLMVRVLDPEQPAALSLRISFLGFAAVFLVPLRLGEFARPLLLKRLRNVPVSAGLGTVAVERTVDGLVMVMVLFVAIVLSGAQDPALWTTGLVAGVIFGGAALAFGSMALAPALAERFWRWLLRPMGEGFAARIVGLLHGFVDGLATLPDWPRRGLYLACTVGYWGLNAWGMMMLAQAMALPISYVQACLMMALLVVGIMIPAGPGSLGTFHAPLVFALVGLWGFAEPAAQAYAIVLHLLQVGHMVLVASPFVGDLSAAIDRPPAAG